jgi:hypothetical protein
MPISLVVSCNASCQQWVVLIDAAFNTLTDFFLTVQPALLIKHTKLATGNKIGVASLFCLSIM